MANAANGIINVDSDHKQQITILLLLSLLLLLVVVFVTKPRTSMQHRLRK